MNYSDDVFQDISIDVLEEETIGNEGINYLENILHAIGNTPLIKMSLLNCSY